MKYRMGFVSNSSTSSYLIAGIKWDKNSKELEQLIIQHLEELIPYVERYGWGSKKENKERIVDIQQNILDGVHLDGIHPEYWGFRDDFYELFLNHIMHLYRGEDESIYVGNVSCAIDFDEEIIENMDQFIKDGKDKLQILGLDPSKLKIYHFAEADG